MSDRAEYAADSLSTEALYQILTHAFQPRPVWLIGTTDSEGKPNLAPYSFAMLAGLQPPCVIFCPNAHPSGEDKQTLANIEHTGQFTVSVVDRNLADAMAKCAVSGSDKMETSGVQTECAIPIAAESPLSCTCRVFRIDRVGEGPHASIIVTGIVEKIHTSPEIFQNPDLIKPIGRLGGRTYIDLDTVERFTLES